MCRRAPTTDRYDYTTSTGLSLLVGEILAMCKGGGHTCALAAGVCALGGGDLGSFAVARNASRGG